jgi:hypothetical protein
VNEWHASHEDERVCEHGHPQVKRWSGIDSDECWFGHPITTDVATCACPGSGRER